MGPMRFLWDVQVNCLKNGGRDFSGIRREGRICVSLDQNLNIRRIISAVHFVFRVISFP